MAESNVVELKKPPLAERLAQSADGILEQIARDYGGEHVRGGAGAARRAPLDRGRLAVRGRSSRELTSWGEVLFIVHTPDIVLECAGKIPPGTFARGYFNIHGDSPIGGHLKAENCTHIAFVSRPFMGRPSRSLQFFNGAGEAMFKIFVRRDDKRELLPEQVARFDALREKLAAAG